MSKFLELNDLKGTSPEKVKKFVVKLKESGILEEETIDYKKRRLIISGNLTFWFVFNNEETIEDFDDIKDDYFLVYLQYTDRLKVCKGIKRRDDMEIKGLSYLQGDGENDVGKKPNKHIKTKNKTGTTIDGWMEDAEAIEVIKKLIEWERTKMGNNIDEIVSKAIGVNKQVIFTGAPGTGKTYTVREVVEEKCGKNENRFKFVQFHSSYDYTDFVEGLRPAKVVGAENTTFVRMDGIFKAFCRKIVEDGLTYQKLSDEDKEKLLEDLYNVEKKEVKDPKDNNKLDIFDGKKEEEQYYFIVDEINRADLGKVFGELMFGLEESYRGIKHRFDTQYMNLPTYIVKDGVAEKLSFDCFKNGFFIPKNLHFIGTMNDIDRSVESFDFALRRRFQWIEIKANEIMEESLKSMYKKEEKIQGDISKKEEENIKELSNRIINMNRLLNPEEGDTFGLSEAYHIGPAYFKSIFTDENLREQIKEEKFSWSTEGKEQLEGIFKHKIASIIREYLRGRDSSKIENLVDRCKKALIPEGIKQE